MKQLYHADGIAAAVDFQFRAAIRGSAPSFECPDEDPGCPMTKYVLCAFNAIDTTEDERMNFMTCWDESQEEDMAKKAEACAGEAKLNWDKISKCQGSLPGNQLAGQAAAAFVKKFPDHATGRFMVPHISINDADQQQRGYEDLLKALCATGIKAGACSNATVVYII